jgi:hypothetical protein
VLVLVLVLTELRGEVEVSNMRPETDIFLSKVARKLNLVHFAEEGVSPDLRFLFVSVL